MSTAKDTTFNVNEQQNRYELHVGDHTAIIDYIKKDDVLFMNHTEAPQALRGTGAAKKLVENALQHAANRGYKVVPNCSYVAKYITEHPEWKAVLADKTAM